MNTEQKRPSYSEPIDIREIGAPIDGKPQVSDRRTFFQLHVFEGCSDPKLIIESLEKSGLNAVLYDDWNHPTRIGVLLVAENPTVLMTESRTILLKTQGTSNLSYRPEMTMIGRTYFKRQGTQFRRMAYQ